MPLARFVAFHELPEQDTSAVPPLGYAVMIAGSHQGVLLVLSRLRKVWELPGGLIDPGETPRQAAIRELAEEVDAVDEDFSNAETAGIDYWRREAAPAPLGHPDEAVLRRFS